MKTWCECYLTHMRPVHDDLYLTRSNCIRVYVSSHLKNFLSIKLCSFILFELLPKLEIITPDRISNKKKFVPNNDFVSVPVFFYSFVRRTNSYNQSLYTRFEFQTPTFVLLSFWQNYELCKTRVCRLSNSSEPFFGLVSERGILKIFVIRGISSRDGTLDRKNMISKMSK